MNVTPWFQCGECMEMYLSEGRAGECCLGDEEMEEETE